MQVRRVCSQVLIVCVVAFACCLSKGFRFFSSHIHKSDLLELEVKTGVWNEVERACVQVKPNKLV
jgi:hypothetical protein